jgi:hypothetical protein
MIMPYGGHPYVSASYDPRAPQVMHFPSMLTLGMHCQWPFTRQLMDGSKTVETRDYPLPSEYVGQEVSDSPLSRLTPVTHARAHLAVRAPSCLARTATLAGPP